jgi:hypothetical protein
MLTILSVCPAVYIHKGVANSGGLAVIAYGNTDRKE